jgi:MoxR-like ATPase
MINGKSTFVNVEGLIINNTKEGDKVMFLFDEINLSPSEVLSFLPELFNP